MNIIKEQDIINYFRLKPLKAAKVSEISEATAISPIPVKERVNFHIGNPVEDPQLIQLFFRIVLGLGINNLNKGEDTLDSILEELGWSEDKKIILEFIHTTIQKSVPYMPGGGFNLKNPSELILYFHNWLTKEQQEPLEYNLGKESGSRECSIASGGIFESLRVFFHALDRDLIKLPAKILTFEIELPGYLKKFSNLEFYSCTADESILFEEIKNQFIISAETPLYLVTGKILKEETRRQLRYFALQNPLFFVEVNNAPNHLSIAREAKMKDRALRFISPAVFSPLFSELSIIFAAGNSEYLKTFDSVHFQLKGTPACAEAELLTFLLKNNFSDKNWESQTGINFSPAEENIFPLNGTGAFYYKQSNLISNKISDLIESKSSIIDGKINALLKKNEYLAEKYPGTSGLPYFYNDTFANMSTEEVIEGLLRNINSGEWFHSLINNFLVAFIRHHPEYQFKDTFLVSGSARTGLSLPGFHCGINEIVCSDYSWSYEHCFAKLTVVPLTTELDIDVDGIIQVITNKLNENPSWNKTSAFVFNNPHNASGQVFDEEKISFLVSWLLEKEIFVIDDLSYQNLAPAKNLPGWKTIQQTTLDLVKNGQIASAKKKFVVTIHSLSKTDCFAGTRMAVAHIPHPEIKKLFAEQIGSIKPNIMATLVAYLFYRNSPEKTNAFWMLRNNIFFNRMNAIRDVEENLPPDRNPFGIEIKSPRGSMYPQLIIQNLPAGLSLEWLASGLAEQGIGLVPLTTFARTSKGFELARKTFRLTLGGKDGPEELYRKTRRILIDLNRLIAEESTNYNRRKFIITSKSSGIRNRFPDLIVRWQLVSDQIIEKANRNIHTYLKEFSAEVNDEIYSRKFINEFLPDRFRTFNQRLKDKHEIANAVLSFAQLNYGKNLSEVLEKELYKESLERRQELFKHRLFDRTVHPTQMYSLQADILIDNIISSLIREHASVSSLYEQASEALIKEFLGLNVAIKSMEEADELVSDLNYMIAAEEYIQLNSNEQFHSFLSFWGDWDGSTRPSGQGHRLVAAALVENVNRLSDFLITLVKYNKSVKVEEALLTELQKLPVRNNNFWNLLNQITMLTNQLEKRYRSVLPFNIQKGCAVRLGIKMHLAKDPLQKLWQHNDRLEKKMLDLRKQRRNSLEYYFSLNKQLRKTLHSLLPQIKNNLQYKEFALVAGTYRNLLNRFILTPRIHQKMIAARDQFPIDTTVHNITEINEISGKYGNPGMILGLQVSMSTEPELLIALDKKLNASREKSLRERPGISLPMVWIIPLFEDTKNVVGIEGYLNSVWEYAIQSRLLNQETKQRLAEVICELFIAGSDLSQAVSQTAGAALYKEAKQTAIKWLAEKGVVENVRIKLGSGEPMQRQGGYYSTVAGKPAFISSKENELRLVKNLNDSALKSTEYAATPLLGVFSGGDLRTFQSSISEKIRFLPVEDYAQLLFHLKEAQSFYEKEIYRAAEPLLDTRLQFGARGYQELERLTTGKKSELFEKFSEIIAKNFRTILYGTEEDVVGIHAVSYFISRTIPNLRDRPAVRPTKILGEDAGQRILERISGTIPFSVHGSLLRAIAHNHAQTMILGINQLTTGLFRSLREFERMSLREGESLSLISDVILPRLPVYEILNSLRSYHDPGLKYLAITEKAFPAGNSALLLLREDIDSMPLFIGLIQKELLRRHGLNVTEFFDGDKFIVELLPALRPDLAVLLQPDIFNNSVDALTSEISGEIDKSWSKQVKELIEIPEQVNFWRTKIWQMLEKPILEQTASFIELSRAIYSVSKNIESKENIFNISANQVGVETNLAKLLKGSIDDSMRQFLIAAVQYLSRLPGNMIEVPIDVIRALKDVERILLIEEQALSKKEQDLLRFYILQIARICGENG